MLKHAWRRNASFDSSSYVKLVCGGIVSCILSSLCLDRVESTAGEGLDATITPSRTYMPVPRAITLLHPHINGQRSSGGPWTSPRPLVSCYFVVCGRRGINVATSCQAEPLGQVSGRHSEPLTDFDRVFAMLALKSTKPNRDSSPAQFGPLIRP